MEVILVIVAGLAIFYMGMRHERSTWEPLVDPLPFKPHRPRLLVSPHWPHREMRSHTGVVGAGLSRGNDEPLEDVDAAGFVPGWSAACPNLSDPNQDS